MASLSTAPTNIYEDVEAATVTEIQADTYLGNGASTAIANGAITAAATTISTTDGGSTNYDSTGGEIKIEDERILYTSIDTSGNYDVFSGCIRGYRGTTAAIHADTTAVTNYNVATVHQKLRDLDTKAYFHWQLPAIAVFATGSAPDTGDTFGQWEQTINLMIEITDVSGVLSTVVERVQQLTSELRRLMRYQLDDGSNELNGIATDGAVWVQGSQIFISGSAKSYMVRSETFVNVTLFTTE